MTAAMSLTAEKARPTGSSGTVSIRRDGMIRA